MNFFLHFAAKGKSRGVSIIELLLVVAIVTILAIPTAAVGSNFLTRNNLQNKTNEVVSSLRIAQIGSISGKEDSRWGVTVTPNQIVLFKGDTYILRDPLFDQTFSIPGSISITNFEVVFDKVTGNPSSTWLINVSNDIGESNSVSINEIGIVDVN